jgi:hypothetical protein
MKERPILFSGPMVRALLEGRKTQTRRLVKPQPTLADPSGDGRWEWKRHENASDWTVSWWGSRMGDRSLFANYCPYGQPGDRLWVRETWRPAERPEPKAIDYRADFSEAELLADVQSEDPDLRWRPSIHMPRAKSRLLLEVTEVRAERLQGISEEDAIAEGARHFPDLPSLSRYGQDPRWSFFDATSVDQCLGSARHAFGNAWNKINGARADWDANPWVWAISFKRIQPETGGAK